jgi:hypothetical protein
MLVFFLVAIVFRREIWMSAFAYYFQPRLFPALRLVTTKLLDLNSNHNTANREICIIFNA